MPKTISVPTCCTLCPRRCGANRAAGRTGFCGAGATLKAARAALHHWEEPCISGTRGSGTVFFSGCTLKCCFCQNYPISAEGLGKEITVEHLAEIFLNLQAQGGLGDVYKRQDKGLVQGYMQQKSSAKEEYTPSFDLTGV